jgi:hypothetical protein
MRVAQVRREQELGQLIREGVPLRTFGKRGHWIIGPLHIYTASGRWFNENTGWRGRLRHWHMRRVLEVGLVHGNEQSDIRI